MTKLISFIKENPIKIFIVFLTCIVLIHYIYFLFGFSSNGGINENFYMDNNITLEKKGVWGDFSSGHFSILAFLWLAYGIYIQSQEFKLQREEFQNQTEQFKEQNKLYEQQMKELEIQSIQNQFDRKIAKLTEIEINLAKGGQAHYDVYNFIMVCRTGFGDFVKLDKVRKYIILYSNLASFVLAHKDKIDLEEELTILKKDIFDGLKLSFIMLLFSLHAFKHTQSETLHYKKQYEHLKITQFVQNFIQTYSDENTDRSEKVNKLIDELSSLDDIDIFEEIELSSL